MPDSKFSVRVVNSVLGVEEEVGVVFTLSMFFLQAVNNRQIERTPASSRSCALVGWYILVNGLKAKYGQSPW